MREAQDPRLCQASQYCTFTVNLVSLRQCYVTLSRFWAADVVLGVCDLRVSA